MLNLGAVNVNQATTKNDRNFKVSVVSDRNILNSGELHVQRQVLCTLGGGSAFSTGQERAYSFIKALSAIAADTVTMPSGAGLVVNGNGSVTVTVTVLMAALETLTDGYATAFRAANPGVV